MIAVLCVVSSAIICFLAIYNAYRARTWREAWLEETSMRRVTWIPVNGAHAGDSYQVTATCDHCKSPVDLVIVASLNRVVGVSDGGKN